MIPDLPGKAESLVSAWLPGETLSVVIGQGYVTATPLQMAVAAATIANGGTVYRPHMVRQVIDAEGRRSKSTA